MMSETGNAALFTAGVIVMLAYDVKPVMCNDV